MPKLWVLCAWKGGDYVNEPDIQLLGVYETEAMVDAAALVMSIESPDLWGFFSEAVPLYTLREA